MHFAAGIAVLNTILLTGIINANDLNLARLKTINMPTSLSIATPGPTPTPIVIIKKIIVHKMASSNSVKNSPIPGQSAPQPSTATPSQPAPTNAPVASSQCVITIDGGRYDVTQFRNIHSGGNVFNCGADMSQAFWSRHNAAILSQMQQYRI